ncbi:MAG: sulfatase [Planctomycetota bacterium]
MSISARIVGRCPKAVHAALLAAALLPLACARPPQRPNVLLIVVDTLRADHLSAYGYGRETSPRLADFAQGAARFTHAESPRAKTTPAVASLLSGLYPHDHGVRDLAKRLEPDVPVLGEVFTKAGYRTVGIVGNYVLTDRRSGLARGFRQWTEDLPDVVGVPPHHAPQRRAASMTDAALVALGLEQPGPKDGPGPHLAGIDPDAPWFCYLHYMDPHGAYDPPEEHRVFTAAEPDPIPREGELPAHPIHRRNVADYNVPAEAVLADGRADAARVRALYDAEIRYADAEIGRLLDRMEAAGQLENTIVVVTADHGESLGEHRYWFEHGFFAYEATCRVPLLVRGPGVTPGVVDEDVSLVDVAPTLLRLCGLGEMPAPAGADPRSPRGVDRSRLLDGRGSGTPHPVFAEKIERQDLSQTVQTKAVRVGEWKLIRRYTHLQPGGGAEREPLVLSEELYDLASDPGETRNLIEAAPATAPLDRLRAELVRFAEADVHFGDLAQMLQRERERLEREEPDVVRILEALGY